LMQRSSVDLPEPDGPMRQTTSPGSTVRSIPLRTSTSPYDLCRPVIVQPWAVEAGETTGVTPAPAVAPVASLRSGEDAGVLMGAPSAAAGCAGLAGVRVRAGRCLRAGELRGPGLESACQDAQWGGDAEVGRTGVDQRGEAGLRPRDRLAADL